MSDLREGGGGGEGGRWKGEFMRNLNLNKMGLPKFTRYRAMILMETM